MTPRSYDPHHLVDLPALDSRSAGVLVAQLASAAAEAGRAQPLPDYLARALERVQVAAHALAETQRDRLAAGGAEPETVRSTDLEVDTGWACLNGFLSAFARLPDQLPQAQQARKLLAVLYPDGLRFTRLPAREEWAESDKRLTLMERDGLAPLIDALGGTPFLEHLRSAHSAYGVALGITAEKPVEPTAPLLGDQRRDLLGALRSYVLQVVAYGDRDEGGSKALAEHLLRPLAEWQTQHPAGTAPAKDPAAAPAETSGDPAA